MDACCEVENHQRLRTIYITLRGYVRQPDLLAWAARYRDATNEYRGQPHMVLADMLGMSALGAVGVVILRDAICYGRARGVVRCVHLSDSGTARLQALRLVREVSPQDDITVEAVSLHEAEVILAEFRATLNMRAIG